MSDKENSTKRHTSFCLIFLWYCALAFGLYLLCGLFYEGSDPYVKYFIDYSASKERINYFITNENLYLFPVFIRLKTLLPNVWVLDWVNLFRAVWGISLVHYLLVRNIPKRFYMLSLLFLSSVLIENVLIENSLRAAGIYAIAAVLYIHKRPLHRISQIMGLVIILLVAFISRVEIPLIIFSYYLVISLIVRKSLPKVAMYSAIFLLLGNFLVFQKGLQESKGQGKFNLYERQIYDMGNVDFSTRDSESDINIKYLAKALFLQDQGLDSIKFTDFIRYHSLEDYIFNNHEFLSEQSVNLYDTFTRSLRAFPFLILALIIVSIELMKKKRMSFLQGILIGLVFVFSIFIMQIIADMHLRVIFIILLFILALGWVESAPKSSMLTWELLFFLGILHVFVSTRKEVVKLKNIESINRSFVSVHSQYAAQGKEVFLGYMFTDILGSNRLFSKNLVMWNFVDCGNMNEIYIFKQELIQNFGSSYKRLDEKMQLLSSKGDYIIMDSFFKKFYIEYIKRVYHKQLDLVLINEISNSGFQVYSPRLK